MKKEIKKKIDQLSKNILMFSNKYISEETECFYKKVNRRKYFDEFISNYPLQYQRNDEVYLEFGIFCKKLKEINICSIWKINRKKTKYFKLSKNKIQNKLTAYANW